MFYTTCVKVLADGSNQPLPNVRVSLYDKDMFSKDDLLGTGQTDASGEAHFRFNSEQFDDEDQFLRGIFPDLYAVVHAADGSVVVSTRAEAQDNLPRRNITVHVPADAAAGLGGGGGGS